MSNQPENNAITSQELRQALLSELEAGRQALAELSDEQLEEIAGGGFKDGMANVNWLRTKGQISGIAPRTREVVGGFLQGLIHSTRIR